jgi:hypothetical protein
MAITSQLADLRKRLADLPLLEDDDAVVKMNSIDLGGREILNRHGSLALALREVVAPERRDIKVPV